VKENFLATDPSASPGPEVRKNKRIQNPLFSPWWEQTWQCPWLPWTSEEKHKATISQNVTMSRRMGLTSSNGLRIKRCRSRWKEGSKFYTIGSKNHGIEQVIFIWPNKTSCLSLNKAFLYNRVKENFLARTLVLLRDRRCGKIREFKIRCFPHDGNRLGNVLDYRGRQRKMHKATISQNVTMSRRMGLTSSKRLRIKRLSVSLERGLQILHHRKQKSWNRASNIYLTQ
jgi:hypothetical protein